jgi:hypothetical protein
VRLLAWWVLLGGWLNRGRDAGLNEIGSAEAEKLMQRGGVLVQLVRRIAAALRAYARFFRWGLMWR